jgi:uncharacterized protein (TIGR02217 family)
MAFHEVQFPVGISWGSSGGPMHAVDVVEIDSGGEQHVARWNGARRKFNAREAVKSYTDLATIYNFALAREGSTHGFRYKDWLDFTTGSLHTNATTNQDQILGTGDGVTTQFQAVKRYTSGPTTKVRNLYKPVDGSGKISFDAVNQPSGWTLNPSNGLYTFSVAPSLGVLIKHGCEFDVPARFDTSLNMGALLVNMEDFGSGSIADIPIIEILDGLTITDDYNYRGAKTIDPFSADVTLTEAEGFVRVFNPNGAGRRVYLPPTAGLPNGGPYFALVNISTANTFAVYNSGGTSLGTVAVAPGAGFETIVEVHLADNVWYLR